ncbi:MAG: hypothetical protein KDA91_05860 [Planctomycetaceae bacterium]|nr:hypothetical protein [Planctomycetaceae bacterium]
MTEKSNEHSVWHDDLRLEINKRLTLNLLIQGAAAHTFMSASHLVRRELEQIHSGLTHLYDQFAIAGQLNYSIGDIAVLYGRPNRWWGWSSKPQKPFENHLLLATRGNLLAREEVRHLRTEGRQKGVSGIPVLSWIQLLRLTLKLVRLEDGHAGLLQDLAVRAVSTIWDLPEERLDATMTRNVAFGNLMPTTGIKAKIARQTAVGYGGVELRGDQFIVVARAWFFPLLIHELVKGTMELICLRGLSSLDDSTYQAVISEADRIEYEPWLLQAGPAMWRRLLSVVPRSVPLSRTIMMIAQLDPMSLEELMLQVLDDPQQATRRLDQLTSQ